MDRKPPPAGYCRHCKAPMRDTQQPCGDCRELYRLGAPAPYESLSDLFYHQFRRLGGFRKRVEFFWRHLTIISWEVEHLSISDRQAVATYYSDGSALLWDSNVLDGDLLPRVWCHPKIWSCSEHGNATHFSRMRNGEFLPPTCDDCTPRIGAQTN